MKTIITILSAIIIFYSCSPERIEENEPLPAYLGEYLSASGDTSFVSENGTYTRIEWSPKNRNERLVFDSVVVNADLTFTDNEKVTKTIYTPPYSETVTNVGTGSFGSNTLQFNFVLDGGHISFSGVKAN